MRWILELFVVSMVILQISSDSGAGECRKRTVECYDCDSRYTPECEHVDPTSSSPKPPTKDCHGCCVKLYHKINGHEYVQRTCTETLIINYFMVDHVCMTEGKGRGKMCFCEERLCNGGKSLTSDLIMIFLSHFSLFGIGSHFLFLT